MVDSIAVLSRRKAGGFALHKGVQFPGGMVAHCLPGRGVCVTSFQEFSSGQPVRVEKRIFPAHLLAVQHRLRTALQERRQYDVLQWNCESFVHWLVNGKAESPQISVWLLVLTGLLALRAAT
jgi:hypothetical protein